MALIRVCDVDGCDETALFKVCLYGEDDPERAVSDVDVCGADHARAEIGRWIADLGGIPEEEQA